MRGTLRQSVRCSLTASSIPIIIYILYNKLYHLRYHKILVQASFIDFSIRCTSYSFRAPLSRFHNVFYLATVFQLVSSFSLFDLNIGQLYSHSDWNCASAYVSSLHPLCLYFLLAFLHIKCFISFLHISACSFSVFSGSSEYITGIPSLPSGRTLQ